MTILQQAVEVILLLLHDIAFFFSRDIAFKVVQLNQEKHSNYN